MMENVERTLADSTTVQYAPIIRKFHRTGPTGIQCEARQISFTRKLHKTDPTGVT